MDRGKRDRGIFAGKKTRMSFLGARLLGKEGSYFYQETKHAVGRLVQNNKKLPESAATKAGSSADKEGQADVLPEVLRHSLPSKIFHQQPSNSSLSRASKWVLHSDPKASSPTPSSNDMNPLRAYLSLPQVTFGPKRSVFPSCFPVWLMGNRGELGIERCSVKFWDPQRKKPYAHLRPEVLISVLLCPSSLLHPNYQYFSVQLLSKC